MIATPPARSDLVKTVTHLEPALPRRRPGRSVTALATRRALRTTPAPARIGSVVVAAVDQQRCEHRSGSLRCVRGPHPDVPQAHVLVAGAPDPLHVPAPARASVPVPVRASVPAGTDAVRPVCCA